VIRYKLRSMLNGEYAPWSSKSPFTFLKDRKVELYLLEQDILEQYARE